MLYKGYRNVALHDVCSGLSVFLILSKPLVKNNRDKSKFNLLAIEPLTEMLKEKKSSW